MRPVAVSSVAACFHASLISHSGAGQWRNNGVGRVDKIQGPRVLGPRVPRKNF